MIAIPVAILTLFFVLFSIRPLFGSDDARDRAAQKRS